MARIRFSRSGGNRSGLLLYAVGWVVAGAAVAALLVWVVEDDDSVTLPPVKQTQLEAAARAARCELRRARPGEMLNPPVDGPRITEPLRPGVYDEPGDLDSVVAAVRRGVIVVHYRPDLPETRVEQLSDLQRAVPEGTIVVPNATRMPFEVAVTGWRRLLGCRRFSDASIDAVRLFRGRFIGRGPDRP